MTTYETFDGVLEVAIGSSDPHDVGLVLKWRRRGDSWEGLVSHVVGGRIQTEWLPAGALTAAD